MTRTPLVLMAILLSSGIALAQSTENKPANDDPAAESAVPVKPKKKKGREWGRFSSARVGDAGANKGADQTGDGDSRKIGQSPRME